MQRPFVKHVQPEREVCAKLREELSTTEVAAEESWSSEESSAEAAAHEALTGETQAHTEAKAAEGEQLALPFSCARCGGQVIVTEQEAFARAAELAEKVAKSPARQRPWLRKWLPAHTNGRPFDLRVSCAHCHNPHKLRVSTREWERSWEQVAPCDHSSGTPHESAVEAARSWLKRMVLLAEHQDAVPSVVREIQISANQIERFF